MNFYEEMKDIFIENQLIIILETYWNCFIDTCAIEYYRNTNDECEGDPDDIEDFCDNVDDDLTYEWIDRGIVFKNDYHNINFRIYSIKPQHTTIKYKPITLLKMIIDTYFKDKIVDLNTIRRQTMKCLNKFD